jgi:hypothetical protein
MPFQGLDGGSLALEIKLTAFMVKKPAHHATDVISNADTSHRQHTQSVPENTLFQSMREKSPPATLPPLSPKQPQEISPATLSEHEMYK